MRLLLLTLAIALSACATPSADGGEPNPYVAAFDAKLQRGEALVAEIGAMHARDRLLRELIIAGFREPMSAEERQTYIDGTRHHFDRIDNGNTRRLREIFDEMTWQQLHDISPSAAEQTFSLISHSNDTAFKRQMAVQFEPMARTGIIQGSLFANLVDDIALSEGRPQVYGMNFECRDGVYQPKPTEDSASLNTRRAEIRLNTIEEYTTQMRAMYGECPAGYTGN